MVLFDIGHIIRIGNVVFQFVRKNIMSLLIFLLIVSIFLFCCIWICAFRVGEAIERRIGSQNYFLLSCLWWLIGDLKKRK